MKGLGPDLRKIKEQLTEDGPPVLDALIMATVALYVPWALFGLIGVGLGSKAPRMSDCFLNMVSFMGLLIMWIIAIMIAVEIAMGVIFADFCFSDPLTAMVSIVNENMEGETAKLITFFLDCASGKGNSENPAYPFLVQVGEFAKILGEVAEGAGTSGTCNPVTMQPLHGPNGAAAVVINATVGIKASLSCESINPMLVSLTHTALCDKTMSGIAGIFTSQVVAAVFMLATLHYASFVRPYMNAAEPTKKVAPVDAPVAVALVDAPVAAAPASS